MRYSGLWKSIVGRFGRWIDFDNDYKTMGMVRFITTIRFEFHGECLVSIQGAL